MIVIDLVNSDPDKRFAVYQPMATRLSGRSDSEERQVPATRFVAARLHGARVCRHVAHGERDGRR